MTDTLEAEAPAMPAATAPERLTVGVHRLVADFALLRVTDLTGDL